MKAWKHWTYELKILNKKGYIFWILKYLLENQWKDLINSDTSIGSITLRSDIWL